MLDGSGNRTAGEGSWQSIRRRGAWSAIPTTTRETSPSPTTISRETEVYQYNAKNQLTSLRAGDTTTRYRYDPQGNLLEERGDTWTKRYTYDAANRQTEIELTGPSETTLGCFRQISRYDGEGLRYETEENGKTICFLYDRGELAEKAGEDSRTSYTRGYDPLVMTRNGAERSYFVSDEVGKHPVPAGQGSRDTEDLPLAKTV